MGVVVPAVGQLWGQAHCQFAVQDMEGHPGSKGDTAGTGVTGDTKPPLTLGSSQGWEQGTGLGMGRGRDPSCALGSEQNLLFLLL